MMFITLFKVTPMTDAHSTMWWYHHRRKKPTWIAEPPDFFEPMYHDYYCTLTMHYLESAHVARPDCYAH